MSTIRDDSYGTYDEAMSATKPSASQRSKRPTLRNIAELAGCSAMSVSRALNGVDISPEVAERVRRAADELGYVPNVAARRMRGGSTQTVGLLLNNEYDPRTEVMTALNGIINEMEQVGYQVLLSFARGDARRIDSHLAGYLARGVDGIFVWNVEPSQMLDRYAQADLPVVAIGHRDELCAGMPLVTFDTLPAFTSMGTRMLSLGHRDAVELTSPGRAAIHEHFDMSPLRWRRADVGFGVEDLDRFVESVRRGEESATVVLADYPRAVQLLDLCERHAVDVPGELSVISLVDSIAAPMLRTPLSSLHSEYKELGVAAAQAMLSAMRGEDVPDVYE